MSLQHLLSAPPEMHPESRLVTVYAGRDGNH